ncbi:MAG: chemotaxis protein CheW [Actinomycetia bacterium]|nr:chemotaxis protein CheW [Actinomycetes bacterium]MCP4961783.1 chemotaxis protein CheW [Actinomycetes bacterium]
MDHYLQLCTFRVGELLLGIDVLNVQEVLREQSITRVPHAHPSISGLINLRGKITTAIDLGSRLDAQTTGSAAIHVVVRTGGSVASVIVDSIGEVIEVDPSTYEAPPETMTGPARELILGAYKLETELLLVPDVERVVAMPSAAVEVVA